MIDEHGKAILNEKGKQKFYRMKIKVFNIKDMASSMHYNPFAYLKTDNDILKFVNLLMANTNGEKGEEKGDFWTKAERLLLLSYIGYIVYELPAKDRNFSRLIEMINKSEASESDESTKNAIDIEFLEKIAEDNSKEQSFWYSQYLKYKLAAGKTAKSILISVGARLAILDLSEVKELTNYDELELEKIGGYKEYKKVDKKKIAMSKELYIKNKEGKYLKVKFPKKYINSNEDLYEMTINKDKTALFLIMSDTDPSFNFLIAILYSQLFDMLVNTADIEFGGKLPVPVMCLCDEFANIGLIPNFQRLIAVIRSRLISVTVILQALSQLKAIYKEDANTIVANCDSTLFLGGADDDTLKLVSERLGKETIDIRNKSESFSSQKSHSQNQQSLGRELMTKDEIANMKNDECILFIRGMSPFKSKKFDIKDHIGYKYTNEVDAKYDFDVAKFINAKNIVNEENRAKKEEFVKTYVDIKKDIDKLILTTLDNLKDSKVDKKVLEEELLTSLKNLKRSPEEIENRNKSYEEVEASKEDNKNNLLNKLNNL